MDHVSHPDAYVVVDGERLIVGRYTLEMRQQYMAYRVERYLIDHPNADRSKALKAARTAWRRKAIKSMQPSEPQQIQA